MAFSAGVVAAHWLLAAQPLWPYWLAVGVLLAPPRRLRVAAMAALGLGWGACNAVDAMDGRVDTGCPDVTISGRTADLAARPQNSTAGISVQRFWFVAERTAQALAADRRVAPNAADGTRAAHCVPAGRIRLTWLAGPPIQGGERWRLRVRLRSPHGTANAHGFDAAKWSVRNRLAAAGYVLEGWRLESVDSGLAARVDRLREALRGRLEALALVNAGVLSALTLGDGEAIPRQDMDRYRRTGTMHLLVISGLHVGVVTAFGFFLGRGVALLLGLPAKASGVALALLFAAGYVLLAGAGLSLLRAFAMSATAMLALVAGRAVSASTIFSYALAAVLLIDPLAPLAVGFWLSFGAVAVLLGFFAPRSRPRSWIRSAVVAQLAVALVFTPATIGLTGLVHPLAVAVNLIAVPVVTLLTVPLALGGVVLAGTFMGTWLLTAADFCVAVVGQVLAVADRVAPIYVPRLAGLLPWVVAAAATCLLPVSRLAKLGLASAVVLSLLWPLMQPVRVPHNAIEVTVLDVGQGTAVLVETASHALLYDAGPAFLTGADAGDAVVLPALRGRGRDSVDVLMLSHSDLDHTGGAAAVLAGIDARRVLVGEAVPGLDAAPCHAGMAWQWDAVRFTVLAPRAGHASHGNNASCVLLIETREARVLLAGDIEKGVERDLELPAVDLLLVPHHGSATSSTADFVAATRPRFAIVGAGWDNPFGHPHRKVVARYRDAGSHILSTAVSGALRWRSTEPGTIRAERCRQSDYWRRLSLGAWRRPSALSREQATCDAS